MIVSPHIFNYRIIIGSLLVVLTGLGLYSFSNYKSIKSYEDFLKQEKVLIETELSEMLESYDELSEDHGLMTAQLNDARLEAKNALDSLKLLKSDLSIISKFKDHFLALKDKSKVLLGTIDSLNTANLKLEQEKSLALSTIKKNSKTISKLEETNASLNKTIDAASILKANSVAVKAYRLKSGKKRTTEKARRTNAMNVCINLSENPLTPKGKKDLYVQIVGPEGNVVSDQGEMFFGDSSLLYSKKEIVNYENKDLQVCTDVVADDDDEPFKKGHYFISIFHDDLRLGATSIELK